MFRALQALADHELRERPKGPPVSLGIHQQDTCGFIAGETQRRRDRTLPAYCDDNRGRLLEVAEPVRLLSPSRRDEIRLSGAVIVDDFEYGLMR